MHLHGAIAALLVSIVTPLGAQTVDTLRVNYPVAKCPSCAEWNAAQKPFRIFGNTYYAGTHGLASILVTSPQGHILIDGALAMSAPQIMANIRALGFHVEDIRLILNSHAHSDHAGGIAALQRASGARVAAMAWSAGVLERGESDQQDPQYGVVNPFPPVHDVRVIGDGDTLRVGPLALVAHATPATHLAVRAGRGVGATGRAVSTFSMRTARPPCPQTIFFSRAARGIRPRRRISRVGWRRSTWQAKEKVVGE